MIFCLKRDHFHIQLLKIVVSGSGEDGADQLETAPLVLEISLLMKETRVQTILRSWKRLTFLMCRPAAVWLIQMMKLTDIVCSRTEMVTVSCSYLWADSRRPLTFIFVRLSRWTRWHPKLNMAHERLVLEISYWLPSDRLYRKRNATWIKSLCCHSVFHHLFWFVPPLPVCHFLFALFLILYSRISECCFIRSSVCICVSFLSRTSLFFFKYVF